MKNTDAHPPKQAAWHVTLAKYSSKHHSPALAEAHSEAFASISSTRQEIATAVAGGVAAMNRGGGVSDLRRTIVRYCRLLRVMEYRFDVSELGMRFVWRDAFQTVAKQGESDLRFEGACCLYNLAALCSLDAIHTSRATAEGIRQACALFQQAAGLLDLVENAVSQAPWASRTTGDLAPATLRTLRTLLLAQAQRCYYEKAVLDGMSPKLLSRIAAQTSLFYQEVIYL